MLMGFSGKTKKKAKSIFSSAGSTAGSAWVVLFPGSCIIAKDFRHQGEVTILPVMHKPNPSQALSPIAAEPAQLTGVTSSKISVK